MTEVIISKHYKKLKEILNKYDEINTHSLQRKLKLGYSSALKIYKYLKEKKIINREQFKTVKFGPIKATNKVGIINKDRLKETLYN